MPSEKILNEKKAIVEELSNKMKASVSGVLVDYKGITVSDDTALRREMRSSGVEYSVVKNTLLKLAAEKLGYSELDPLLNGTTAIALSEDAIAPSRLLYKFASKHPDFKIKGGFVEGKVVSVDQLQSLSKLSSKEALIAQVLGGMNAVIASLAICINAIAEKQSQQAAG